MPGRVISGTGDRGASAMSARPISSWPRCLAFGQRVQNCLKGLGKFFRTRGHKKLDQPHFYRAAGGARAAAEVRRPYKGATFATFALSHTQ